MIGIRSGFFIALAASIVLLAAYYVSQHSVYPELPVSDFHLQGAEADNVIRLPDQPEVDFQQFAGYITVDEVNQRNLFYYFVESEVYRVSKPVVLWLNGGVAGKCFLYERCAGGSEFCKQFCQTTLGSSGGHCTSDEANCCCD